MRIPLFHLHSTEYRRLRLRQLELEDDVAKLLDKLTAYDNRLRSGLRKQQPAPSDSRPDADCGCADTRVPDGPTLVVADGEDRTAVREQLHRIAKSKGYR